MTVVETILALDDAHGRQWRIVDCPRVCSETFSEASIRAAVAGSPSRVCPAPEEKDRVVGIVGRPATGAEAEEDAGAWSRPSKGDSAETGSPSRVCPAPEEKDRVVGIVGRPASGAEGRMDEETVETNGGGVEGVEGGGEGVANLVRLLSWRRTSREGTVWKGAVAGVAGQWVGEP